MLKTIRDFKNRLVVAMMKGTSDPVLDAEVDAWLSKNKLWVLDALDQGITDYEKRRIEHDQS